MHVNFNLVCLSLICVVFKNSNGKGKFQLDIYVNDKCCFCLLPILCPLTWWFAGRTGPAFCPAILILPLALKLGIVGSASSSHSFHSPRVQKGRSVRSRGGGG